MGAFITVAALMALCAAAAVAWPLLRDKHSRIIGVLAAVLVPAAAAGFYALWTNWDWSAAPAAAAQGAASVASPEVAAMVAKLEKHLQEQPDDLEGWLMLGRSYLALERLDDAIVAYDHAERLGDGKNIEAILGLGESLSLRAGGEITPQVANLFEAGVTLAPDSAKALLYGGFAAAVRGESALARSRWLKVKTLHPPAQVEEMIDQRLADLGSEGASASVAQPAVAPAAPGAATAAPPATATVTVAIAPALKARLKADAPLFVFARETGGKGPPLAVKRLTIAAIGTQVQLSDADSMMPGRRLSKGQRVSITARVAFSGQPLPTSGDLFGELTYEVGRDGVRELLIDQVTP